MPSRCESRLWPCFAEPMRCDRRIRALPCRSGTLACRAIALLSMHCRGRAEPCRATAAHSLAAPSLNRAVLSEQSPSLADHALPLLRVPAPTLAAALRRLTKRCHSNARLCIRSAMQCPTLHRRGDAMLRYAAASPFLAVAPQCNAAALLRQPMRTQCNDMLRFAMPLPRHAGRSAAVRTHAEPLRCYAEPPHIQALPLRRPSMQLHRATTLCGTERPCPVP